MPLQRGFARLSYSFAEGAMIRNMVIGRDKNVHTVRVVLFRPCCGRSHGGCRIPRLRLKQDLSNDADFMKLIQNGAAMRLAANNNDAPAVGNQRLSP